MNGVLRSTRGVQRDEVWQAADALLQEGKRPTIERVRLKLGRGSPNTVSPMLEEWFATLGPRLGTQVNTNHGLAVNQQAKAGERAYADASLPEPLRLAMQTLWHGALEQAGQVAQKALQTQLAALQASEDQLAQDQAALLAEREAFEQQRPALEQALASAHAQARLQGVRIAELEAAAVHKDATISRQAERNQQLEREVLVIRRAWDENREKHAAELRERQQQMDAQNRHHMQELDRMRQEVKQLLQSQRQEQSQHIQQQALWQRERIGLQAEFERAHTLADNRLQQLQDTQAMHAAQSQADSVQIELLRQQLIQAQTEQASESTTVDAAASLSARLRKGRAAVQPGSGRTRLVGRTAPASPRSRRTSLR